MHACGAAWRAATLHETTRQCCGAPPSRLAPAGAVLTCTASPASTIVGALSQMPRSNKCTSLSTGLTVPICARRLVQPQAAKRTGTHVLRTPCPGSARSSEGRPRACHCPGAATEPRHSCRRLGAQSGFQRPPTRKRRGCDAPADGLAASWKRRLRKSKTCTPPCELAHASSAPCCSQRAQAPCHALRRAKQGVHRRACASN